MITKINNHQIFLKWTQKRLFIVLAWISVLIVNVNRVNWTPTQFWGWFYSQYSELCVWLLCIYSLISNNSRKISKAREAQKVTKIPVILCNPAQANSKITIFLVPQLTTNPGGGVGGGGVLTRILGGRVALDLHKPDPVRN